MRSLRRAFLVVVLVGAAACTSSSRRFGATPTSAPSNASTIPAASPTATGAASSGICDPYVAYVATGVTSRATIDALAANTPPDAPAAALDAVRYLQRYTGGPIPAEIDDALEAWVLTTCHDAYFKSVQPRATTQEAAQILYDAVTTADRRAALPVAIPPAIARFEPWGPLAAPPSDRHFVIIDDETFRFMLGSDSGDYFECRGSSGVILTCDLIQPSIG